MKKSIFLVLVILSGLLAFGQTIPNGGFENWTTLSYEEPTFYETSNSQSSNGVSNPGNTVKTNDSYHGNFAIKLTTVLVGTDTSFAFYANGDPGQSPPQGGIPYSLKPTGLRCHYKSNIVGTDSAMILVIFKKAGVSIGNYLYKIGVTQTSYTLFNHTFSPALTATPDTIVFAAASSNAFAGTGLPGNMLQLDSISFTGVAQQPIGFNGDLELWQTKSTNTLNGWNTQGTTNQLTGAGNIYSGTYALELQTSSQSFGGGIRPGFATTGIPTHVNTIGGYPYTQLIDTLFFYYKYLAADPSDSARVSMDLKKNGTDFFSAQKYLHNTGNSYVLGKIPFDITGFPQAPPDSAILFIQSSNQWPAPASFVGSDLKIDNMYLGSQRLPVSKFTIPTTGCVGHAVQFTDESDNMVTSWQWITGGGNPASSNAENPTIAYNTIGTHTITMQAGNSFGTGSPVSHTITIFANPSVVVTSTTVCQGNQAIVTASGATTYTWSTSAITASISVTPTTTTVYTVTGTDVNGCSNTAMSVVNILTAPIPDICMVSVDDSSKHNIIFWDKTVYLNVDSFIAYREVSTNVYKRIGAQAYSALSQFLDTAKSIGGPNGGNPNSGTYRYKLQTRDTCGNYSILSPYHNTVYITNNGNGHFSWATPYQIEGQASPDTNYVLACDTANINIWTPVASVAGTQQNLSDPGFIHHATIANWRVDALGFNCTPTLRMANGNNSVMTARVKSHSNQSNNRISGIKQVSSMPNQVSVYPNPSSGSITISNSQKIDELRVTDMLGNVVYETKGADQKVVLRLENSGVYFVTVISGKETSVKKVVVNN